jgi:hypothetical protein
LTPEQELATLLERKAKADALPDEVRAKHADLYTQICVRIAALTRRMQVSAPEGKEISPPLELISTRPDTRMVIADIFALDLQLACAIARGDAAEAEKVAARWVDAWNKVLHYTTLIEQGFEEVQIDIEKVFSPA